MKQRISENFLYITNLEERVMYTFSVRAQTIADGPPASRSALWIEIVKEGGIVGERGRK